MEKIAQNLLEAFKALSANILFAISLILLSVALIKIIMAVAKHVLYKTKLRRIAIKFVLSIIRITLIIVATIFVATKMGVPATNFVAVTTALSLGVSFAVRDMLTNTASGLMLLYSRPFKEGDYLEIDSTSYGVVKSMDITRTDLITPNNQIISVPNSKLTTNNIINYNSKTSRRIEILLDFELGIDYEKISKKLSEIENKYIKEEILLKSFSENNFILTKVSSSSISLAYYMWTTTENYENSKNIILKEVYNEILMKKDNFKMGVN